MARDHLMYHVGLRCSVFVSPDELSAAGLVAADVVEGETLSGPTEVRYPSWGEGLAVGIREGSETVAALAAQVESCEVDPIPVSGRQGLLENRVNKVIWTVDA